MKNLNEIQAKYTNIMEKKIQEHSIDLGITISDYAFHFSRYQFGNFEVNRHFDMKENEKPFKILQLDFRFYKKIKKYTTVKLKKSEFPIYADLMLIIMDYWYEVKELLGYTSIFIRHQWNDVDEKLASYLTTKLNERYLHVEINEQLQSAIVSSHDRLLFADFDKKFTNYASNFFEKYQMIKNVLDENPLILESEDVSPFDISHNHARITYLGTSYSIGVSHDLEKMILFNNKDEVEIASNLNKKDIENLFKLIKDSSKVVNIIENPRDNFNRLISTITKEWRIDVSFEFEKLIHELGDWESVEKLSSELLSKHKNKDFKEIIHTIEKNTKIGINCVQFKMDDGRYFYVVHKADYSSSIINTLSFCCKIEVEELTNEFKIELFDLLTL